MTVCVMMTVAWGVPVVVQTPSGASIGSRSGTAAFVSSESMGTDFVDIALAVMAGFDSSKVPCAWFAFPGNLDE